MNKASYRPDIDGLRAVAVLSVLFYHLHITGFSGGYIGVDVFFVISGYLITSLINSEIQRGSFSLKKFYLRRVRRLAPALIVMLVPVALVAYIVLKPDDLRSFGLSFMLLPVTLQNVVYLAEGEYFRGAELKPLLHTWSLSVEEQFYLLWPVILIYLGRFQFKIKLILVGSLIIGSFVFNLALMSITPKASFFLLPPRAWELGVGCLVALLAANEFFCGLLTEKIKTLLAFVGLLAVLYSVFWFTSETPFPGASALIPVVGTSFLLFSEIGSLTGIGKFFSLPLMVRIGLISYPMYLWHWPIISLLRQFQIDSTQPVIAVTIVFATIVLAEITYRFVESPIRQRRWFPDNYLLLVSSTVGFAFVVLFGMHLWISDGASYRYSPIARSFLTAPMLSQSNRLGFAFRVLHPKDEVGTLREDITTDRRILLWGNSHADMWSGLLMDMTKENKSSLYLNARNCRATTDSDFCCDKVQQSILDFIVSKRITDVILASTWHGSYDITDEVFERQFREVGICQ